MKNNFSILISNTTRSIQYLIILRKNSFNPNYLIYLDDKNNSETRKIIQKKLLSFNKSKLKIFNYKKINHKVGNFLINLEDKNIIYSGYPGILIKNEKLLKHKNIIHNHPGKLPQYKGSTTIYYSLLKDKNIHCSTLILNKKIDSGKILLIRRYNLPKNIKTIDREYDDKIRSLNLEYFLKNSKVKVYEKKGQKKILPYYVIHPILRSLTFKNYMK